MIHDDVNRFVMRKVVEWHPCRDRPILRYLDFCRSEVDVNPTIVNGHVTRSTESTQLFGERFPLVEIYSV